MSLALSDHTVCNAKVVQLTGNVSARRLVVLGGFAALIIFFSCNGSVPFLGPARNPVAKVSGALVNVQTEEDTASRHGEIILWGSAAVLLTGLSVSGCVFYVRQHASLMLLPLWSLMSVLWSANAGTTLRSAVPFVLCTVTVFSFCVHFKAEARSDFLVRCGLIAAIGSIFVAVGMPKVGQDYVDGLIAWRGIFSDKNICAFAMVLFLTAATARSRWWTKIPDLGLAVLSVVVLVFTQSRTGWVIAAIYVLCKGLLGLLRRFRGLDTVIMSFVFFLGLLFAAVILGTEYEAILRVLGKDASLTGRVPLWIAVWTAILSHPWVGYGYSAFWNGTHGPSAQVVLTLGWMVPHAHNGLLDLWLGLGIVGVSLFVFSLVLALRDAVACFSRGASEMARWYAAVIVVVLSYNATEVSLVVPLCFGWVCYVIACVGLHEEAELATGG
jgi:exopolysaccharide production protein ExoQ